MAKKKAKKVTTEETVGKGRPAGKAATGRAAARENGEKTEKTVPGTVDAPSAPATRSRADRTVTPECGKDATVPATTERHVGMAVATVDEIAMASASLDPHVHKIVSDAVVPAHYGEDMLCVVVRDARWLHCYWELEGGACQRLIDAKGRQYVDTARWVLRVAPQSGALYNVGVDPGARNWYLEVAAASGYRIELGLVGPDGQYHAIARGGDVRTPPAGVSDRTDATWGRLREELDRLLELVGSGASWMSLGSRGYAGMLRARQKAQGGRGLFDPNREGLPNGYLMLVLHAHLPYVRHPEQDRFLEEDWFFEAVTETYIPLADMFTRLADEGIHARAAMTLSPPLCEMMADPLLQRRYSEHLGRLISCADAALGRMRGSQCQSAAEMYCGKLRRIRTAYHSWDRDLVAAFRSLRDRGVIEILTCGATHGILPLMKTRQSMRAQVELGCRNYHKHFGSRPEGIWLPECAYAPELDDILAASGIRHFFLDSHGVLNGTPQPRALTYRPVVTPAGVAAFARDAETGIQVWSAEHGYPGDPVYREFYRDLGYDGDHDMVRACLSGDGSRHNIGLKYHRVTGKVPLDRKEPYVPDWAQACARAHAEHFVGTIEDRTTYLRDIMGARPVICAMYDAELFGHWWYEGVDFLEHVLRRAARRGSGVESTTPHEYLAREDAMQVVEPSASSWGDKGYYEHWLNGSNDWIYRHLHKAEERMQELARRFPGAAGLQRRALNQAARELLLAQSSDWAFLIYTGTARTYATKRTKDHVVRFSDLYQMLMSQRIDEGILFELEERDAIFQEIEYGVFAED